MRKDRGKGGRKKCLACFKEELKRKEELKAIRNAKTENKYWTEYAITERSTCYICKTRIEKDAVRIGKLDFNVARNEKFFRWHHVDCFKYKYDSEVSSEEVKGINNLKEEDQISLSQTLDEKLQLFDDEDQNEIIPSNNNTTNNINNGNKISVKLEKKEDEIYSKEIKAKVEGKNNNNNNNNNNNEKKEGRINFNSKSPWEDVVGYSRAVKVGNLIFISGCTGIKSDGKIAEGGVYHQTKQTLINLQNGLRGVGAELKHVVRTRMFVKDIREWEEIAKAHSEFFDSVRPATSMIEISKLINPSMLIEIEADAVISD